MKYRLKEDRLGWPAGTIVFDFTGCNYGLRGDDTRATGIEHICVTQDPNGGTPFITATRSMLEEVRDPVTLKPYDNYEISPCTRTEEPDSPGKFYFEVCEPREADCWTLYGHIPGEGAQAIGDFDTREHAEEAFQRITGIPFAGAREVEAHLRMMHAGPKLLEALQMVIRVFDMPKTDQSRRTLLLDWEPKARAAIAEAGRAA